MIRVLDDDDRERVLGFLDRDHELNLIMIYDLTHFGMVDRGLPFQGRYYGAFGEGELGGVAVLYNFGSMFIYAPDPELAPELAGHMAGLDVPPRYIICRDEWCRAILEGLGERGINPTSVEEQEYMTLTPEAFRPRPAARARFAEPGDIDRIMELHRGFQIEYFGSLLEAEEELGRMAGTRMRDGGITVASAGGEVVSKAEIMVRTSRAALIGGSTPPPATAAWASVRPACPFYARGLSRTRARPA